MQFDSRPIIVYGIRVANKDVGKLVRRVLLISGISALLVVALTVLNFTVFMDRTTVAQTILSCIIGICIPLLGWFGAKSNNRNMVGAFCSFSFSCSIFNAITYILVMVSIAAVIDILNVCGTASANPDDQHYCDDYTISELNYMYIVASAVTIPVVILQCLGGFYGNRLYESLCPEVIVTYGAADPPYVYEVRPAVIRVSEVATVIPPGDKKSDGPN